MTVKRFALRLLKSNRDIQNYYQKHSRFGSEMERRKAIRIAVIDDSSFSPQMNLQNYGYSINAIGDIKLLSEIEEYNVILCDVMGVGMSFDKKLQGASIISEIKLHYPDKIVIAYTGGALNKQASAQAASRADRIIKKDVDIEDWISTLDSFLRDSLDPYRIWNRIRRRLIDLDVDTKDIIVLEDSYVRSILSGDRNLHGLGSTASKLNLGNDARAIVQGLVSSIIFKTIIG